MNACRLVLDRIDDQWAIAILEDGKLVDFETVADDKTITDELFLARVTRIDRHLDAAFLECGTGEPGFITAKDARHAAGVEQRQRIDRTLREGQRLVVQGVRERSHDKGPKFTSDIRLFAPSLILRPCRSDNEISRRLRGRERELLSTRAGHLFPQGGVLLRRAAADTDDADLIEQEQRLRAWWAEVSQTVARSQKPHRLAAPGNTLARAVWRQIERRPSTIEFAEETLRPRLREIVDKLPETMRPSLDMLTGAGDAFERTEVRDEIERLLGSEVPLAGGGRVIIEPTAACIAIDVDSGGRPALEVNLEAAAEIGLQLRLRNLGGTIIIDFIDLPTKPQRQRLEEALRKAFREDPLPVQIYPMSPLGIVQLSRARRGARRFGSTSLACPVCGGSGGRAVVRS